MYTNNNETDNIKRIFIKDVSNQNNIADELTKIDIINERDFLIKVGHEIEKL